MVWEPLKEDEAPGVDEVVELAVRLEERLRAGEKVSALCRASLRCILKWWHIMLVFSPYSVGS